MHAVHQNKMLMVRLAFCKSIYLFLKQMLVSVTASRVERQGQGIHRKWVRHRGCDNSAPECWTTCRILDHVFARFIWRSHRGSI